MAISGTIESQTESAVYTYDNLRRLVTSAHTMNGVSAERRFEYDRWGNRTGVWDELSGGSQIQSVELEESGGVPTNRLDSVETSRVPADYTCDAAGNVTDDDVNTYVYDAKNRLVSINSGAEQYNSRRSIASRATSGNRIRDWIMLSIDGIPLLLGDSFRLIRIGRAGVLVIRRAGTVIVIRKMIQ
jgi:hypothetical protein